MIDTPIALLLLNDKMTVCAANATGKKYLGRGNACSRYTTSDPERFGKYDANSKYTASEESETMKPRNQKIKLSPTDPVPAKMADARHTD